MDLRSSAPTRGQSSLPVRDFRRFRQAAQTEHRQHTEKRPRRKNRERIPPAHKSYENRNSVMQAENCGESAMTVIPQTADTANNRNGFPPKRNPTSKQQVPLMAMAHDVTAVLPSRSASRPPPTQPSAPQPMIRNEENSASSEEAFRVARLARIITGIQAHMAYSSHMWPR